MSKKRTQRYYLKQCRRVLQKIQTLEHKEENRETFERLKRKANKYLQKAKEFGDWGPEDAV